jgi:flavin reductase ActVB
VRDGVEAARHNPPVPGRVTEPFIAAMSQLASGVVMVTCTVDGQPWGLTVSACCSVSVTPALLLVSLGQQTTSARAIGETGRFGVSILGEAALDVARFGSAKGQPKFVHHFCHGGEEHPGGSRTPVVAGAIAHVDCVVEQRVGAGDHVIYLGAVEHVLTNLRDSPLVYYDRRYHRLGSATDLGVGPVADETIDSLLYDYPMPLRFSSHGGGGENSQPTRKELISS